MLKFLQSKAKRQAKLRARAARMKKLIWLIAAKGSDFGVEVSPPPPRYVQNLEEILTLPIDDLVEDDADKFLRELEDAVPDMFRDVK